jgi:hypothetical protein
MGPTGSVIAVLPFRTDPNFVSSAVSVVMYEYVADNVRPAFSLPRVHFYSLA